MSGKDVISGAVGLCLAALAVSTDAAERLEWRAIDGGVHVVAVTGISPERRGLLQGDPSHHLRVHVEYAGISSDTLPPLAGEYSWAKGELQFRPRFPLAAGLAYEAAFKAEGEVLRERLVIPKPVMKPRATVSAVYPSGGQLPENLLKFYLHFSHPMSRGDVYRHITLLDDKEQPVDLPFLEIGEELWNPEQTRLTVLIDPGRIKRGVKPLEDIGPALISGRSYTLHVGRDWRDARGAPMKSGHRYAFRVGPPDRAPPDPGQWRLKLPVVGTSEPVVVTFPEPLEHALASRVIGVVGPDGKEVSGRVALTVHERVWSFTPDRPWPAGRHVLKAATILEDLAGNSIGRPFEVDQFERVGDGIQELPFSLPFELR